jgi:hypothetical protein
VQHLIDEPASLPAAEAPPGAANASLRRVSRLLARAAPALPARVRVERRNQTTSFLLRALADRARELDGHGSRRSLVGHDLFVANLVDVLVAVLTAPPSPATRRVLAG